MRPIILICPACRLSSGFYTILVCIRQNVETIFVVLMLSSVLIVEIVVLLNIVTEIKPCPGYDFICTLNIYLFKPIEFGLKIWKHLILLKVSVEKIYVHATGVRISNNFYKICISQWILSNIVSIGTKNTCSHFHTSVLFVWHIWISLQTAYIPHIVVTAPIERRTSIGPKDAPKVLTYTDHILKTFSSDFWNKCWKMLHC